MDTVENCSNWFAVARFGMFIHWGVYARLEGRWKEKPVETYGEWIIEGANISKAEYLESARLFNPVKYNAEDWVITAKNAGVRYIVFTAKHADGFCMFKSAVDEHNIVDGTVYGRDVLLELANACKKHEMKLGIYYSQCMDYNYPGASRFGKTTDPGLFAAYIDNKVKPQIQELMTNYGHISTFWFDNPFDITKEQCEDIYHLIKRLQPQCLVNARLGHGYQDYIGTGDNQSASLEDDSAWEMPATMNDTWGYKVDDNNWKTKEELLFLLIDCAARGGNYLLNVGPTGEGVIPEPSKERIEYISRWLKNNGDAIFGTRKTPFNPDMKWVRLTVKGNKLFIFPLSDKSEFSLFGLKNEVKAVRLLDDNSVQIPWVQSNSKNGLYHLALDLRCVAGRYTYPVVAVDFIGELDVDSFALQETDYSITLPAVKAVLNKSAESAMEKGQDGVIYGWKNSKDYLTWEFNVSVPGTYEINMVVTSPNHIDVSKEPPEDGYEMHLSIGGKTLVKKFIADEKIDSIRSKYFPEYTKSLGEVGVDKPGRYTLELKHTGRRKTSDAAEGSNERGGMYLSDTGKNQGLTFSRLELLPC